MAELIVVGFKRDMFRASEVLNTLQEMNESWVVDLDDAVAVYRDYSGRLRVDQSYRLTTGEGAAWGALGGLITACSPRRSRPAPACRVAVLAAGSVSGVAIGATVGAIGRKFMERGLRDRRRLRPACRSDGSTWRLSNLCAAAHD